MTERIKLVVDWLEVWSLLIPLFVITLKRKQPVFLKPVVAYVLIAFVVNLLSNISWKFKHDNNFPVWFQVNTYFYSIHAVARLFLLCWFFLLLKQPFLLNLKKIIPVAFLLFIIIHFSIEPFVNYWYNQKGELRSTLAYKVLAVEAAIMLFYCLQYYLFKLQQDVEDVSKPADLWIVTGLAIFSFCSFPIYFFYNAILENYYNFTINIWLVQKIAFLIFCISMARAFYISQKKLGNNGAATNK